MQFETFVVVRLIQPDNYVALPPEEAARNQDAHLANVHRMWAAGQLIGAGPSMGSDERVRGFGLMTVDLDTARALWADDPGVRAGRFIAELSPWTVPAGMLVPGPTAPPASIADVRA